MILLKRMKITMTHGKMKMNDLGPENEDDTGFIDDPYGEDW